MDPLIAVAITAGLMIVLIVLEMPIAFAIGFSASVGLVLYPGWSALLYSLGTFPVSRIASFTWSALPLYVLLGSLVTASGVGADAYEMANRWFGKLKGGLILATVVASGMIAATTGSGATSIAFLGKMAVPEMEKLGYSRSLATGAVASCGPLGTLIPPSMAFILVGILAEISIGKLFIAGILPGILTLIAFMTMVYIRCAINPKLVPSSVVSYTWKEKFISLGKAWGIILIFIFIIGGLYTGIATATEVAALGCLVGFIMVLTGIPSKRSSWKSLWQAIIDTIGISAIIFAFVIGTGIFSLFLTLSGIVNYLIVFIQNLPVPTFVICIIVVLSYIALEVFFDPTSMLMVTVPIFYPVLVDGLGVDPLWFSVITVIMVEISALTPPVGMSVFVMHAVYPKASVGEIYRGVWWFITMNLVVIAILFIFPQITTWLPDMMW